MTTDITLTPAPAADEDERLFCFRHPERETWIRCQRCDRPICPDCMNSAAVGFQCPSCIKEGARTTRSGRLPYGGTPTANPALSSIALIALNVAVWLSITSSGGARSGLVDRLALSPLGRCTAGNGFYPTATEANCSTAPGGHWVHGVADGAYWQLGTAVFSHVEVWHIAFNMLALYFLGPQLEMILGRARFLAVYLLSGLASSTAVLWLAGEHSQTLGASGAIFGLMGALLVVGLKLRANVQQLLFWIGIKKFTYAEIEAVKPLMAVTPWIAWLPRVLCRARQLHPARGSPQR